MNSSHVEITIVIPNWNGHKWLPDCLDALQRQTFRNFRTVIIDNGSVDGSVEWVKQHHPGIRLMELGENTGFAHAVNIGIQSADSPYVALLNTDTEADPAWLDNLYRALRDSDESVGAVCGKMLMKSRPDRIENAGDTLSWQFAAEKRGYNQLAHLYNQAEEVISCCAGAALYRKSFLDKTSGFDRNFFAYLEDIDLGLRGRLMGYRYKYEPSAIVLHQGHGSGMPSAWYVRLTTANRLRLLFKNTPGHLILRRFHSILYGQWYFLVCQRRPIATLSGYLDFIMAMPQVLRQRRVIRASSKISSDEIDALLLPKMCQPGLFKAIINRIIRKATP